MMYIVCADIYNPIPINSGGDWYRYQLFSQVCRKHKFTLLYTTNSSGKEGYVPSGFQLDSRWIKEKIIWKSINIQLLRPEMVFPCFVENSCSPDVVLCTHYSFHIGRTIARRCKVPLILITHNVEWQYWKANGHKILSPLVKALEFIILNSCDAIITPSKRDANTFSELVSGEKVFCIPPKPDNDLFNSSGNRFKYPSDRLNVLFYGSLDREHNIEALYMLFDELIPIFKKDNILDKIRINIFGSGSPPEILMNNLSKISYYGCVNNPAEYIRGADIVIAPLKNSGGVKIRILESLSCGKQVIATAEAVAGLPDELKRLVTVVNGGKGFSDAIKNILIGETENHISNNSPSSEADKQYCMEDVFNYVLSRRS